jgi:RES domain-containing protein
MPETSGPEPPALTLWRAYVPRWAHLPLSGEGAARFGGRWNAVGQHALYAALELSTAWAEYNQGFVQHPATIARLELRMARLADLTDAAECARLKIDPSIHACEWRAELDAGRTPATHRSMSRWAGPPADLVIRNGRWVNVHSGEIIPGTDVAIAAGRFAYCGPGRGATRSGPGHAGDRRRRAAISCRACATATCMSRAAWSPSPNSAAPSSRTARRRCSSIRTRSPMCSASRRAADA